MSPVLELELSDLDLHSRALEAALAPRRRTIEDLIEALRLDLLALPGAGTEAA